MPSQKQEFSFPGQTTNQLLLAAYGTFLELGWTPKYAGPNAIIGYTPRSWNKYDDEILVEATDGTMTVTSSLVHNETFDMMGKNKKHINDFIAAFENVKTREPKVEWAEEIEKLRNQTVETAAEQVKQAEEVNKAMSLTGSNLYITYAIIAINVIVFVLMAINGAGILKADPSVHIRWGSNYSPLTLSGDWWRVVTCIFIHFGIIHLVMNTYALYMVGVYLEPMLGKTKYIVAYLCTGIIASIVSLWWHKEGVNSAGASGAIFGMYGVFLALLFTNLIPKQVRISLLQSIGVFVVYNLIYGMKSGVDNAAHIGGLVSGIIIGFIFYTLLKKQDRGSKSNLALIGITAATILSAWLYLNSPGNKVGSEERQRALNEVQEMNFADAEAYLEKMKTFSELETEALAPFNEKPPLNNTELSKRLNTISAEKWDRALGVLEKAKTYNVSEKQKKQAELLIEYVTARKEEIKAIEQLINNESPENNEKLNEINRKIEGVLQRLKELN
jgi:rhomboid protease GluP